MWSVFATAAFAALAAAQSSTSSIAPGAVASAVAPPNGPPSGCSSNYNGAFAYQIVNISANEGASPPIKRNDKRATLVMGLHDGILTDTSGRTGYIASNQQFQFDKPPQAGAIYTAGFSVCPNSTLALGDSTIWYACLSGTFYNLYDTSQGGQCHQVFFETNPVNGVAVPGPASSYSTTHTIGSANATTSASSTASSYAAGNATSAAGTGSSGSMTTSASASGSSSAGVGGVGGGAGSSASGSAGSMGSASAAASSAAQSASATSGGSSGASQSASSATSSASASSNDAISTLRSGGSMLGLLAGVLAFAL